MASIFTADQWKPGATAGNRMVSAQRELPVLSDAPPSRAFRVLSPEVMSGATFTNTLEAMALHSGQDRQTLSKAVHISKGYLTKVLGGVGECRARLTVLEELQAGRAAA
jgi:hypothetical protein